MNPVLPALPAVTPAVPKSQVKAQAPAHARDPACKHWTACQHPVRRPPPRQPVPSHLSFSLPPTTSSFLLLQPTGNFVYCRTAASRNQAHSLSSLAVERYWRGAHLEIAAELLPGSRAHAEQATHAICARRQTYDLLRPPTSAAAPPSRAHDTYRHLVVPARPPPLKGSTSSSSASIHRHLATALYQHPTPAHSVRTTTNTAHKQYTTWILHRTVPRGTPSLPIPPPTDTRRSTRHDSYAAGRDDHLSESFQSFQSTDTVRRRPEGGYGTLLLCLLFPPSHMHHTTTTRILALCANPSAA